MWTRKELKGNAKLVLKRTYWLSFAICLVAAILAGVSDSYGTLNMLDLEFNIKFPATVVTTVWLFSLLYGMLISNPLEVGLNDFFLSSRQYDVSFSRLFSAFNSGAYGNIVKTMFLQRLYIFLWTFLLIIPGIIKSYQYFFISYILAENPEISTKRAFEISKAMTDGDKFRIFVLQLSFLGWMLLGFVCLIFGINFVVPYVNATFAELYAAKRTQVLMNGDATEDELCGFRGDEM